MHKLRADLHLYHVEFKIGDYVMIRIRPERFPTGTLSKLHSHSAGPFQILQKVGPNAYVIDIPCDYGFSSTFNVEDLCCI